MKGNMEPSLRRTGSNPILAGILIMRVGWFSDYQT